MRVIAEFMELVIKSIKDGESIATPVVETNLSGLRLHPCSL